MRYFYALNILICSAPIVWNIIKQDHDTTLPYATAIVWVILSWFFSNIAENQKKSIDNYREEVHKQADIIRAHEKNKRASDELISEYRIHKQLQEHLIEQLRKRK